MKLKFQFTQVKMVDKVATPQSFFTEHVVRTDKDVDACIHAACNKFEDVAKVILNSNSKTFVWSKTKPFDITVTIDGKVVVSTEKLKTISGVKLALSLKNADMARNSLFSAVAFLKVSNLLNFSENTTESGHEVREMRERHAAKLRENREAKKLLEKLAADAAETSKQ